MNISGLSSNNLTIAKSSLHPNYAELLENKRQSNRSEWFRDDVRGSDFQHVVNTLRNKFQDNMKKRMLIVGVADAQEPFSYLALLYEIKNGQPPKKYLDLHCVDLRPGIKDEDLKEFSFYDRVHPPIYAASSFDNTGPGDYVVKQDIFDYLKNVFNNPEKTRWNTDIADFAQDEAHKDSRKRYDVISCNHVLIYLKNNDAIQTAQNLVKLLKPGGILIARNSGERELIREEIPQRTKLTEIAPGIFRKKSKKE